MSKREARYSVFGNPVTKSLSPFMHNAVFRRCAINARYDARCVADAGTIIEEMKRENIRGGSVTLPHKVAVMQHLDKVTDSADRIGAVNTIIRSGERFIGDNTDWLGIVQALKECMEIGGKRFIILGAGGTARSALYGITREGGLSAVVNRTSERGEALAREFDCDFIPLSDCADLHGDCLINTTPVGMYTGCNESPVPGHCLGNFTAVMDVVYNPLETKLLREARQAGCLTVSGLSMFVWQGAEQLKRWLGIDAPVDFMKKIVRERLNHASN